VADAEAAAGRLIEALGALPQILAASPERIDAVAHDDRVVDAVAAFRGAMMHVLRMRMEERPLLPTSSAVRDYLKLQMATRTAEEVRVLYLTGRNDLIRDEVLTTGTLDQAPIFAREIVHRALDLGAANLILAHNHPSGDATPSAADVRLTKRLRDIALGLDLRVLDHLIVGRDGVTSMRAAGLI